MLGEKRVLLRGNEKHVHSRRSTADTHRKYPLIFRLREGIRFLQCFPIRLSLSGPAPLQLCCYCLVAPLRLAPAAPSPIWYIGGGGGGFPMWGPHNGAYALASHWTRTLRTTQLENTDRAEAARPEESQQFGKSTTGGTAESNTYS